jgi:hypothetical protein
MLCIVTRRVQSIAAMSNATRRQQDTMISKSKHWCAVQLAPGADFEPAHEMVGLLIRPARPLLFVFDCHSR